jgi:hypothetical protein
VSDSDVAPDTLVNVAPPSVDSCHWTVGVGLPEAAAVNVADPPTVQLAPAGGVVTTGALLTVSVAAFVVAEPTEFVNTARYWVPFWAAVTALTVSVAEVAPLMFVNVELPLGADCHWTVGVGVPEAAAVNVALPPAVTVWLVGCVVIAGATSTVSVAAVVVADPCELVNTARYSLPFSEPVVVAIVSVADVALETLLNVAPPSVDTCHCTVGVGLPFAEAVNVAEAGAVTVTLDGGVAIVGADSGWVTVSVAALLVAEPTEFVNTARYCVPL